MADNRVADEIFKTIDIMVDHKLYLTEYTYTEDCVITSATNDPFTYRIQHEQQEFDATSPIGEIFEVGQSVVVLFTDYSRLTKKVILFGYSKVQSKYKNFYKSSFLDNLIITGNGSNSPNLLFRTNSYGANTLTPTISIENSFSGQSSTLLSFPTTFVEENLETKSYAYFPVMTTILNPTGNYHNENLRLPRANNGYSSVHFGGLPGTTFGTGYTEWTIYTDANGSFVIDNNNITRFRADINGFVGLGSSTAFTPTSNLDIYEETTSNASLKLRNTVVSLTKTVTNTQAQIMTDTNHPLVLGNNNTTRVSVATSQFGPLNDNGYNLGSLALRWQTVYAGTGTIQTSDKEEKQDIENLSDVELAVAKKIKVLVKKYRFKDAVKNKPNARIHVGFIAQDVIDAFLSEGLDPFIYGIVCNDEWYEKDGEVLIEPEIGAVKRSRLGIRYDELFAFLIAVL